MKRPLIMAAILIALTLPTVATDVFSSSRLREAISEQRRLLEQSPSDSGLWNDLGNLLRLAGRNDDAIVAYSKASSLSPDSIDALFNRGLLLEEEQDFDAAVAAYQAVLNIEPDDAWSHYQLGSVAEKTKAIQAAIQHYARSFELDPYLAFPDVNPQVLRSRLVTQAMLARKDSKQALRRVPRAYADRERIADLLVPSPRTAGAKTASESTPSSNGVLSEETLPDGAINPLQGKPTRRQRKRTPRDVIRE
jgi:tetratricopeptide (TPR) repeat protein